MSNSPGAPDTICDKTDAEPEYGPNEFFKKTRQKGGLHLIGSGTPSWYNW
jgi:hypothetical protein